MIRRPISGRRGLGWAALAAGLVTLAVGAALAVTAKPTPPDTGSLDQPAILTGASPPGATPDSAPASMSPPMPVLHPSGSAAGVPQRLLIPALNVDATINPVGVDRGGALAVPADPHRLGWWIGSARPGGPGTVLLAGHVDTAENGPGALFGLERLPVHTTIVVLADGVAHPYQIVARRSYPKSHLPAALFATDAPTRLAMVTCGGQFRDGTYSHNVVVYADPLAQMPP